MGPIDGLSVGHGYFRFLFHWGPLFYMHRGPRQVFHFHGPVVLENNGCSKSSCNRGRMTPGCTMVWCMVWYCTIFVRYTPAEGRALVTRKEIENGQHDIFSTNSHPILTLYNDGTQLPRTNLPPAQRPQSPTPTILGNLPHHGSPLRPLSTARRNPRTPHDNTRHISRRRIRLQANDE